MHRVFISALFALALSSCEPAIAKFAPTPLPYSCDTVRAAVKAMSPAQLKIAADTFNVHVSASQIKEARKCLAK